MIFSDVRSMGVEELPSFDEGRELAKRLRDEGVEGLVVEAERSRSKSVKFLEHFGFLRQLTIGGRVSGAA